jgi:ribonuclease HI
MPKAAKGGFYAVRVGKVPGVYSTWCVYLHTLASMPISMYIISRDECKAQVGGAPGAKHKKFATYEEAHEFAFPDSAPSASATTASASRSIVKVATATRTKSAPEDENEDGFMVIYTDGACKDNQGSGTEKRAGLGVWWGAGDDRYVRLLETISNGLN